MVTLPDSGHMPMVTHPAALAVDGQPQARMSFTISAGKIVAIDILGDPERLGETLSR